MEDEYEDTTSTTTPHGKLENEWSRLNANLLCEADQYLPYDWYTLIYALCMYGREIFTWWDLNYQGMKFQNRRNGKKAWNYLDENLFNGLNALNSNNNNHNNNNNNCFVADNSNVAAVLGEWQNLINAIGNSDSNVFHNQNNLSDLNAWLHLLVALLLNNHNSRNTEELIHFIVPIWLKIHSNLLQYSSYINGTKFKVPIELINEIQSLVSSNSCDADNCNVIHLLCNDLMCWNMDSSNNTTSSSIHNIPSYEYEQQQLEENYNDLPLLENINTGLSIFDPPSHHQQQYCLDDPDQEVHAEEEEEDEEEEEQEAHQEINLVDDDDDNDDDENNNYNENECGIYRNNYNNTDE